MRLLLTLLAAAAACPVVAAPIFVGVLEEPQCAQDTPGTPSPALRPLFVQRETGWTAVGPLANSATTLDGIEWSLALDGKQVGSVRTATAATAALPVLALADGQKAAEIGNRQARFEGWCGTPTRRPLAASSAGHTADPDRWKPFQPDPTMKAALFKHFTALAGPAQNCSGETLVPLPYTAADLVVAGGYEDRNGRRLVGLALDSAINTCDGPPDDAWKSQWFVVGETVKSIGAELSLVEAVDFDADGRSELLFWHSGYNQDGYVLLDDTLTQTTPLLWSYH